MQLEKKFDEKRKKIKKIKKYSVKSVYILLVKRMTWVTSSEKSTTYIDMFEVRFYFKALFRKPLLQLFTKSIDAACHTTVLLITKNYLQRDGSEIRENNSLFSFDMTAGAKSREALMKKFAKLKKAQAKKGEKKNI